MYPTTSRSRRLVNYLVDRLLALSLATLVIVVGGMVLSLLDSTLSRRVEYALIGLAVIFVYFLYYFVAEWRTGRTLAKYLTRTQVLNIDVRPLTASQALRRTIARLLPFGKLSILIDKNNRTWHDKLSSTVVVDPRAVPPQYRPNHEKVVQIGVACLILLMPGAFAVAMAYDAVTGGERFDLPKTIPADFRLTKFEKIQNDRADYYRLTYSGDNRAIEVTRLIAGFNFDPREPCVYTRATKKTAVFYEPMDNALTCDRIADGEKFTALAVNGVSSDQSIVAVTPDYILEDAPFDYSVKAISGSLTRQEVEAMTVDSVTMTEDNLRKLASANSNG